MKQPTPEQLKALLKLHGVTRKQAAELLYVSEFTVHSWCNPADNKNARPIPIGYWELLNIKLSKLKQS